MTKQEKQFIKTVWKYYECNGRHDLPWRKTNDPYKILVSEIMLQQTQVERVIPKYSAFLKQFGTVQKLSKASLGEVLTLWQGLGYNRRAKMLHLCAKEIICRHKGKFPTTSEALLELPGIGPYTSSAVAAFAFNTSTVFIETNIRSVYLHHFFNNKTNVSDREIVRYIVLTLDTEDPREWYYALMDYGSYIKKEFGNPNKRSAHHVVQSTFKDSDRQIRGAIIRLLSKGPKTRKDLHLELSSFEDIRVDAQIEKLLLEFMIVKKGTKYQLPS